MDTSDIASSLVSMSAASTQQSIGIAVMKQQFAMQKSVVDILDPPNSRPPAAPGTGRLVDKTA